VKRIVLLLAVAGAGCIVPSLTDLEAERARTCDADHPCLTGYLCASGVCQPAGSAECTPGDTRPCGQAGGECRQGTEKCSDAAKWDGTCTGAVGPVTEVCDGKDNDCDGTKDDNAVTSSCGVDAGVCAGKSRACLSGTPEATCSAASFGSDYEAGETRCDGLDNDCDGLVDAADPDCPPWSHAIAIDGVNDFTAEERFATTSGGYTGWITWDADHLYVGYQGPEIAAGSATKWLLIYFGAVGPGTTAGVTYTTQSPHLPFPATHHARLKLDRSFFSLLAFNGSAWSPAATGTMSYGLQGDFVELRFPLANLGAPATLAVHVSMISEAPGEWTWGGIPSTTFPSDGYDRDYTHYLEFDLAGTGAPASYPPR